MNKRTSERGLFERYRDDPDEADRTVFNRMAYSDRRGFLKNAGLATMAALVGAAIPFHRNIPEHFIPVALAEENILHGKDGLVVLKDRPVSAETLPHLLDDDITPTRRHFIRNNGIPPKNVDPSGWTLTIDGLVYTPMIFGIDDLKQRFDVVTLALALGCAGNGRAFFDPPARVRSGPMVPSPAPSGPASGWLMCSRPQGSSPMWSTLRIWAPTLILPEMRICFPSRAAYRSRRP